MIISELGKISKIYELNHPGSMFDDEKHYWFLFEDRKEILVVPADKENDQVIVLRNEQDLFGFAEHDDLRGDEELKLIFDQSKDEAIPHLLFDFLNEDLSPVDTFGDYYEGEDGFFPIIYEFKEFFKLS